VLFRLREYADAEAAFIGKALDALAQSRGGFLAQIRSEPTSRTGGTQITTDAGEVVEFEPAELVAEMKLQWEDIADGRIDALLATIDEAAGHLHDEKTKWVLGNIEQLAEATGNTVDASGRPLFDAVYEMFEKVEMTFEDDGSVSKGFAFVMHPDMVETMKRFEAEMTPEQRKKLDDLIDRKREEFFARRRRRELS
jgi:hypothetical protein